MERDDALVQGLADFFKAKGVTNKNDAEAALDDFDRYGEIEDDPLGYRDAALKVLWQDRVAIGSGTRPRPDARLLKSPFRFVDLATQVVAAGLEPNLAKPIPDGFCGVIDVTWEAETPLLIGEEGSGNTAVPFTLTDQTDYVIPGATVRGLTRAAVEIVALARLSPLDRHHRFGLRDFMHPDYAKSSDGQRRFNLSELGAGWLRKARGDDPAQGPDDSEYVIEPCDKATIRIRDLPRDLNGGNPTDNGAFHLDWLQRGLKKRLVRYAQGNDNHGRQLHRFEPLAGETYEGVTEGDTRLASGGRPGVLVVSDLSPSVRGRDKNKADLTRELDEQNNRANPGTGEHKKRECVFFSLLAPEIRRVTRVAFANFEQAYCKPSKGSRVPDGNWKVLEPTLAAGGSVPVFFVGDLNAQGADFAFGLTRVFKIGHAATVGDKARRTGHGLEYEDFKPDFVESLFGHVYERADFDTPPDDPDATLALKGRIAFGFARLTDRAAAAVDASSIETVMMGPRGSFAPFYLKGRFKDWSDAQATLAGRKRYFPRFTSANLAGSAAEISKTLVARNTGGGDLRTRLRVLKAKEPGRPLVFVGTIRLHNVSAAEMGGLLWPLTHGGDPAKPYRHMVGRAKTAGAGQLRVAGITLRLVANGPQGKSLLREPQSWELPGQGREGWIAPGGQSMTPFLQEFEHYMRGKVGGWPDIAQIREFLGVSDPAIGAALVDEGLADYPSLDRREFVEIRRATQKGEPAPAATVNDRYLSAPRAAAAVFPYKST